MIIECNVPNEVHFNQSNLASYMLLPFNLKETSEGSHIEGVQEFSLRDEALQKFMDIMIYNMQCLGEDTNPSILWLPSFCHLHCVSHSKVKCPCFQDAISRV